MATVVKTLGTAGGRDHSTWALWEADLDDDTPYDAGDDAVGDGYADSDFTAGIPTFDGGDTLGLASATLQAASGQEHDGTADTGVIVVTGVDTWHLAASSPDLDLSIIFIEWQGVDTTGPDTGSINITEKLDGNISIRNNLFHEFKGTVDAKSVIKQAGNPNPNVFHILDNIFYDIATTGTGATARAVLITGGFSGGVQVMNNTAHDVSGTSTADHAGFYGSWDKTNNKFQNCIATNVLNAGDGDGLCYRSPGTTNATESHNAASDTTANGTGSIDSITTADQYVSTTGGSEDLHLKSGSDGIDAGTDLVTTPNGVEIDINGRNRDSEGDTWDMGAHELVAAPSGGDGTDMPWPTPVVPPIPPTQVIGY